MEEALTHLRGKMPEMTHWTPPWRKVRLWIR
jgi:hypothetical protein